MCDTVPTPVTIEEKCDVQTLQTPMEELNDALRACRFGRFHLRLLFTVFIRNLAGALVSSTTPYLLMSAECDLGMTLVQKGLLNSIPFIGMCSSIVVAGFLTDAFGRRIFVLVGQSGMYIMMMISGCSQSYEWLLTSKFLEGVFQAIAHAAAMTMTAEFCHKDIRDRMMMCQFSFTSLSQVVIALMSWAFLIHDWKFTLFHGYIVLNTWNIYLIAMAQWGLVSCILYQFLPESPKFLLTQRKYGEVREILINIYKENTGKSPDTYEFANIWKEKPKEEKQTKSRAMDSLSNHLVTGLHNVKPMFKKPLGIYLMMLCTMNLLIMAVYNVVRLWFPQLSTIVEHYAENSTDLCGMLDSYTSDLKTRVTNNTESTCVQASVTEQVLKRIKSGTETYINAVIFGIVCFLPYCVNGFLVDKLGKKVLIIVTGVFCIGATLASRWANSRAAVVSLFSLNAGVLQSMISLFIGSSIELFPTTIRSFATSITMMVGRLGTLVGNVSFPILLNMGCVVPFFTMTGLIACVVLMSCFMPSKGTKH